MLAKPLYEKLNLKPGHHLYLMNGPADYTIDLPDDIALVEVASAEMPADVVHLFVRNRAELDQHLAGATERVKDGGMLWVSYPKGSSGVETDINRDSLADLVIAAGWRPVRQVAVDEVWSALRFKPEEDG
jgi:hypothetical protein